MTNVIIVGDGPGGLSAALFLAKNGIAVTVFGEDNTAMHWAYLYNYLGIKEISGSDFQLIAREQASSFGADLKALRVREVAQAEAGFIVTTTDDAQHTAQYVILSEGKIARFAKQLGLGMTEAGVTVDRYGRCAIANLYVVGRGTNINRSQAIISAGEGAASALDILSIENGKDFNDFDTPPKDE